MKYILDSNVFIQAHRLTYPLAIFPGYWQWLEEGIASGLFILLDKVAEELTVSNDELSHWIKRHKNCVSKMEDEDYVSTKEVMNKVITTTQYKKESIRQFSSGADTEIIGYAKHHDFTVVTYESKAPESRTPKIPDVCDALQVSWLAPLDLLERLKPRFVLDKN